MEQTLSIEQILSERFENKYGQIQSDPNSSIVFSYIGDLVEGLTFTISNKMEEKLMEMSVRKPIVKKLFSIVIEGLQNIRLHGEHDDEGQKLAAFICWHNQDKYFISFSNLMDQGDKEKINSIVSSINEKEKMELKQHYISVMNNGIMSKAGGAGLGLITMAMKSENIIRTSFTHLEMDLCIVDFNLQING